MKNETWVVGGRILTMNAAAEIHDDGVLGIADGKLTYVGPRAGAPIPAGAQTVDASNSLVLPGLVNGHTHTGMTLLRGIADDLPLEPWLKTAIFPTEEKWGSREFVYLGTRLAACEMIRGGTTLFNDMYYFEEMTAQASLEAGLRLVSGQTLIDINDVQKSARDPFEIFDEYLATIGKHDLLTPAITPHSIYGLSRSTWERVIEYARRKGLLIHTHLSETQEEVDRVQAAFGKTPAGVFDEMGLWKERVVAAHATCVTPDDIALLGSYQVGIAYNPESNLKLGTRICPVVELRRAGCPVAFGTDGTSSNNNLDLLQEADTGAKLQAFRVGVGKLTAFDTVKMLTSEGARALGLGDRTGSLEVGKSADWIAVATDVPHATPLYDPYSHLVYSASGHDVRHNMVAGRLLMENRKLLTLDESAILAEAKDWGRRIAAGRR